MPGKKFQITWLILIFVGCLVFSTPAFAQEGEPDQPVVHAVLFYSPTCPHCHEAINNVMIPLMEQYGERLAVIGIDVSTEAGSYLFGEATVYYETPENRQGVPTLIVEDTVLVSTMEIENEFPGIIEATLAAGGNRWPDFPGLAELVAEAMVTPDANQEETAVPTETPTTALETAVPIPPSVVEKSTTVPEESSVQPLESIDTTSMAEVEAAPPADPVGFALGWLVLLGLLAVLIIAVWQLGGNWHAVTQADTSLAEKSGRNIGMWALIVIGLVVSGYLAYVEMTQVKAVCGPVGECNIVQSSPYAQIASIPIAVLGLLFYLAVAGLWLLQRIDRVRHMVLLTLVALTIVGTLFSLYLTLLELLVIGAICMWCLTSAVVTGLLCLLVVTGVVKRP
ncbi:MAG: vitamin K epoxide reductase family protein [Anaerolineae bacterium]|nr:vitamin K epoxide reductase family protein [Anaerolineae bacterium]